MPTNRLYLVNLTPMVQWFYNGGKLLPHRGELVKVALLEHS